jgi:nucleotide-binding universal stress UspA family protein
MLEITERMELEGFPALAQAPIAATSYRPALRSIRSKRLPAIWLLSSLGLIPLGALVLFPERWHELPYGVQWAGYLASLILLTAACSLIVNPVMSTPLGTSKTQPSPERGGSIGDFATRFPTMAPLVGRKPRPFQSILVPLDGSPLAEQIIPLALEIARAARSKVRLVLVHQIPQPSIDPQSSRLYVSTDLAVRKVGRDYLNTLRTRLRKSSGLQISAVSIDGPSGPTLVKYVQDIGADLVAMTTHGRGGLRGSWLGGIADHLIRSLEIPVIVVRAREGMGALPEPPKIKEILVPLDGSLLAEAALVPASALAELFGAELLLVQVVWPLSAGSLLPVPFPSGYDTEVMGVQRKETQAYLDGLFSDLREREVSVRATVVVGHNVAEALLELAHPQRIDLVAIATHGRGGVQRLILGSVADKLVRAAGPPVLVVRPGKG